MRLIDADEFFKDFTELEPYEHISHEYDIDAVEVVRCKDCKYWQRSKIKGNRNHDYHICLNSRHGYCIISFENDYCSRGRRTK